MAAHRHPRLAWLAIEQLKISDPLTNPTAHGASASDAFHLVIPSMAGYGFSGKPTTPGWDPAGMARAWVELMKRLGYSRFAAQGGDWGAFVTNAMAEQAHPELIGIHLSFAGAAPPDVTQALQLRGSWNERAYHNLIHLNAVAKVILPPGNSRRPSRKNCARASDRCADSAYAAVSSMLRRGWATTLSPWSSLRSEAQLSFRPACTPR
jgi:pimeloyl-ACP methyl ester carboxylesterase